MIATNTTISREGLKSDNKAEMGVCQVNLDKTFYRGDPILSKSNKAFPIIEWEEFILPKTLLKN
jgi:hypothetical protein